jgi:hypothetical protein
VATPISAEDSSSITRQITAEYARRLASRRVWYAMIDLIRRSPAIQRMLIFFSRKGDHSHDWILVHPELVAYRRRILK